MKAAPQPEQKRRQAGHLSVHAGYPDALPQVSKGSGGRNHPDPPPQIVNRRVQVAETDHPATDRWITLTTARSVGTGAYVYLVAVVDGFNRDTRDGAPEEFTTLDDARKHANQLYNAMTEEDDE